MIPSRDLATRQAGIDFRKVRLTAIAVIWVVYLFSAKGYLEILDTQFSVETAFSLYDHGSFVITHDGEGAVTGVGNHLYSKYGVGLPLSFLPYVAIATGLSHLTHFPREDLVGFLVSFANIPFALATLFLFSRLLEKFGVSEKTNIFSLVALGLGTICWRYAAYDFSEEVQMTFLTLAVCGVVKPRGRDLTWGGLGFGALLLFKLVHVVLWPCFALYLLVEHRGWMRLKAVAEFSWPIAPFCGLIGWLNALRFGSPFEAGYQGEANNFWPLQLVHTVPALLLSLDKGLFIFCPVLVLGIFGWRVFIRKYPAEALLCGALILSNLLMMGAWYEWNGGWAWGPRFLVPLLPLWILPVAFLVESAARQRWFPVFSFVLAFSVLWQIPGILVRDQEIHLIKQQMAATEPKVKEPSDPETAWLLCVHKLNHAEEVYRTSDFNSHAPPQALDLGSFRTYHGYNIWTEQVSRQFRKPVVRWLPLLGVLAIAGLLAPRIASCLPRHEDSH